MKRFWQALLISLVLGVVSLWLVLPSAFSADTLDTFGTLGVLPVVVVLGLVGLWWVLSGWRIMLLAKLSGSSLTFWQGLQTHVIGVFSSAVTPAGGGNSFGIAWILTRFGLSLDAAVAVTVLTLVLDMAFFAWGVPVSFIILLAHGVAIPIDYITYLISALSIGAITVSYLLIFQLPRVTKMLRWLVNRRFLKRFAKRTEKFLDDLEVASQTFASVGWRYHLAVHALSGLSRIVYFIPLSYILVSLGAQTPVLDILSLQIIVHSFAFLIPTPGASGYQEAALSWVLKGQMSTQVLSSAVILWRVASYYLYFFVGPLIGGFALFQPNGDAAAKDAATEEDYTSDSAADPLPVDNTSTDTPPSADGATGEDKTEDKTSERAFPEQQIPEQQTPEQQTPEQQTHRPQTREQQARGQPSGQHSES